MYLHTSRSEHLEVELYKAAEQGLLSKNTIKKIDNDLEEKLIILYSGEIRRLQRKKLKVVVDGEYDVNRKLFYVTIDWSNPFPSGKIPHLVYSYINGIIDTFPTDHVQNLAQKLYVIAHRANNKK